MVLYSLYEYISKSRGENLKKCFQKAKILRSDISFEDVFLKTRHLVAHGYVGGDGKTKQRTVEVLKEFLGNSDKLDFYSFNRYNESHVNLINEVLHKAQILIMEYLNKKLKISS